MTPPTLPNATPAWATTTLPAPAPSTPKRPTLLREPALPAARANGKIEPPRGCGQEPPLQNPPKARGDVEIAQDSAVGSNDG